MFFGEVLKQIVVNSLRVATATGGQFADHDDSVRANPSNDCTV